MGPDKPPPTYAPVLYLVRFALAVGIVVALIFAFAPRAHALQLSMDQCQELAVWASDTIWAKHVGADKERVRAFYAEQRSPVFTLLLRDFEKIWGLDMKFRIPLFRAVLEVCAANRGIYPDET